MRRFSDAFDPLDDWEEDPLSNDRSDEAIGPTSPLIVQAPIREGGAPPKIHYAQITTTSRGMPARAMQNLDQNLIHRGLAGMAAVALYDPSTGRVEMTVFTPDHRRVYWRGALGSIRMPPTTMAAERRNSLIEARVRRLIGARTGQRFGRHRASEGGPDARSRERPAVPRDVPVRHRVPPASVRHRSAVARRRRSAATFDEWIRQV